MKSNLVLLFVITLVVCLTQFASDIYAPSLPSIAHGFQTDINLVQWSMAIYLLGVAVSQLVYGPLSEGFGRKKVLLFGLFLMLVGSLISLFAQGIDPLIWGRLVQGCGAGACAALWRSVFRDVFTGDDLAKYGSYLVIFIMFIVPAAPALGAYLAESYSWQASFVFMAVYSLISFFAIFFFFTETSKYHHPEKLKLPHVMKTYAILLKSPLFMGVTFCTFLSYGAFFAWFVTGPVLLIEGLNLSPITFGWITFLGGGSAYALAGWINGRVVKRFGMANMMRFGWSVMIVAGALMGVGYLVLGMDVWAIAGPAILFYFGSTFIWPNAFATAFTPYGQIAGYTGALYGFMQISGGATLGGLMSYLPDENQLPLACIMLIAPALSWIFYESVTQKKGA